MLYISTIKQPVTNNQIQNKMNLFIKSAITSIFILAAITSVFSAEITIKVSKRYLNLPVSQQQDQGTMKFSIAGKQERSFRIRLAAAPE
ncbi:MAG: hypothetical protein EOO43_18100, partial [Flavobacterium sp.]